MEDEGSGFRGLWDKARRVPVWVLAWVKRFWLWLKALPAWLWRTWPVSLPLAAAGVLLWLLPGWNLKLRYSGFALEAFGLFLVARRLYLIRKQFEAPAVGAVISAWWRNRPRMGRRHALAIVDGVAALSTVASLRGIALPGAPPPDDAPIDEQIAYLRRAMVGLRDTVGSIHGELHKRIDEVDAVGKRRITEIDAKLATETTRLDTVIRDSTAGNVQREQWAVVLLFLGTLLMIASAHVQP